MVTPLLVVVTVVKEKVGCVDVTSDMVASDSLSVTVVSIGQVVV